MEIKGTIVDICMKNYEGFKQTIFIEPADLKSQLKPTRELKVGDKVWVEAKISDLWDKGRGREVVIVSQFINEMGATVYVNIREEDIIAAFPAESEKVELPVKVDIDLYKDPAPALAGILLYDLADKFIKLLAVVKEMREKE